MGKGRPCRTIARWRTGTSPVPEHRVDVTTLVTAGHRAVEGLVAGPHAPDRPPLNGVVDALAGILDKVRNAWSRPRRQA